MRFDDDEPKIPPPERWVELEMRKNDKAPLEEHIQLMELKLTVLARPEQKRTYGLDIVAILDVSKTMEGFKLAEMKKAMLLLMTLLVPEDRLSIVQFSSKAERLCPLRAVTQSSLMEFENLIRHLQAKSWTENIADGLRMGQDVLRHRKYQSDHVIILLSDGRRVSTFTHSNGPPDLNIHIFGFHDGFGSDNDSKVVKTCNNWYYYFGLGSYVSSDVRLEDLHSALKKSLSIDGVMQHDFRVKNLTLTVTEVKDESTIQKVSEDGEPILLRKPGSTTFKFSDDRYSCTIEAQLLLPQTSNEGSADVLVGSYRYKYTKSLHFLK